MVVAVLNCQFGLVYYVVIVTGTRVTLGHYAKELLLKNFSTVDHLLLLSGAVTHFLLPRIVSWCLGGKRQGRACFSDSPSHQLATSSATSRRHEVSSCSDLSRLGVKGLVRVWLQGGTAAAVSLHHSRSQQRRLPWGSTLPRRPGALGSWAGSAHLTGFCVVTSMIWPLPGEQPAGGCVQQCGFTAPSSASGPWSAGPHAPSQGASLSCHPRAPLLVQPRNGSPISSLCWGEM